MSKIQILDGGMGRELERIGAPFRQPEWSALALIEAPHFVEKAHLNFINSGAEIITTNAYAVIPHHIGEDLFQSDGRRLIKLSADIARKVAKHKGVKVAGCIPPLFGSYLPDQFDESRVDEILTPLIEGQKDAVDMWIMETVSSTHEAITIGQKLSERTNKPIWLSFTIHRIDSTHVTLRHGNYIDQAIKEALGHFTPDAILFNCCAPDDVSDALRLAKPVSQNITLGVYANNFLSNDKRTEGSNKVITKLNTNITPEKYASFAQDWINEGATIFGGCCGIGPEYIKHLAEALK
jgi:S-methylmethionine-dependent homocysteine/selenocysteine methylase